MVQVEVCGRKGTMILSNTLLASILVLAAAVAIFLIINNVLCKTGTSGGGVC